MLITALLLVHTLFQVPMPSGGMQVHGGGSPAITFVQGCVNNAVADGTACAPITVVAGDLILLASKTGSATVATPAVSSTGVTCPWTVVSTSGNVSTAFTGTFAWCIAASSGTLTPSVLWSGPVGTFTDIAVGQYNSSTGWATSPVDVTANTVKGTASTSCVPGTTSTTTSPNELVVAICEAFNNAQTWGTVAGYTNRATSSRNTAGWYDKVVTSVGTQSFTATIVSDIDWGFTVTLKAN